MQDLATLRPLVEIMAAERCPDRFDDAVQEGMIAAWNATQERPDAPGAYIRAAARNGVVSVARGRPFTGHVPHRGWQDAHAHSIPYPDDFDVADPTTEAALERVERHVIAESVRWAVGQLHPDDQDLVRERFWGCAKWPRESVRRRFIAKVAPTLRELLQDKEKPPVY